MANPDKAETTVRRPQAAARPPGRGSAGSGLLPWVFVGLAILGGVAAWPALQPLFNQLHLGKLTGALPGEGTVNAPPGAGTVNAPPGAGTVNAPSGAGTVNAPPGAGMNDTVGDQASFQPVTRADRQDSAIQSLSMRLDVLERRIGKAEESLRSSSASAGSGVDQQKVAQDLAQLRQEIDGIENTAASVRHLVERKDRLPLFLLALGHLREAVDRGAPYETELRAAAVTVGATADAANAGIVNGLALIQTYASAGVESRASLALRFHDVSSSALREATGAEASPLMARVLRWVGSAIHVRRTENPGDVLTGSPSGAIIRAGRLVALGDFNAAVTVLQPVAGQGGDALNAWLRAASARVAVDAALSELSATALAKAAAGE